MQRLFSLELLDRIKGRVSGKEAMVEFNPRLESSNSGSLTSLS